MTNMFAIPIGAQVSLDNSTWYNLSDHNRNPISITYSLIEQSDRMANGTLRKYVVARKFVITTDWKDFPTIDTELVDYNPALAGSTLNAHGAAWIKSFYEQNAFVPVYIKLIYAQDPIQYNSDGTVTTNIYPNSSSYIDSAGVPNNSNAEGVNPGQIFYAYMTTFTYDISKRRVGNRAGTQGYDLVNLKIEFTEI